MAIGLTIVSEIIIAIRMLNFKNSIGPISLSLLSMGITPFDYLMGMLAAATSTVLSGLKMIIVGCVVEMFAIEKIDYRTTGRN